VYYISDNVLLVRCGLGLERFIMEIKEFFKNYWFGVITGLALGIYWLGINIAFNYHYLYMYSRMNIIEVTIFIILFICFLFIGFFPGAFIQALIRKLRK
jgi:ABC-type multidrug transport system permease subunit